MHRVCATCKHQKTLLIDPLNYSCLDKYNYSLDKCDFYEPVKIEYHAYVNDVEVSFCDFDAALFKALKTEYIENRTYHERLSEMDVQELNNSAEINKIIETQRDLLLRNAYSTARLNDIYQEEIDVDVFKIVSEFIETTEKK